jgi:type I site-specific restriction endonuclease
MLQLQFSKYNFSIRVQGDRQEIFDIVRKKYVALTPEEWVRQHIVHYLVSDTGFPKGLISVEKQLLLNGLMKRTDIVLYNQSGSPVLIVECKATDIPVTQAVFDQAARYNLTLLVPYLWVTNGREHFISKIDHAKKAWAMLDELPAVQELTA